jgi:hypothetical protein
MRIIEDLCPPALLYLLFIVIQSGLDLAAGNFITASVKLVTGSLGAVVLDLLCDIDLGIVSWFIIASPFIITTLATSIALGIGLDRMIISGVKETFVPGDAEKKKKMEVVPSASDEIK